VKKAFTLVAVCLLLCGLSARADADGDITAAFDWLGQPAAGISMGDWTAVAAGQYDGRGGAAYLTSAAAAEGQWYAAGIDKTLTTDLIRLSLGIAANGGDPQNINGHNLLADALSRPGLSLTANIFGLLALDFNNAPAPAGCPSREEMIAAILAAQLADGGFAVTGTAADTDVTAMALQALAPYAADNRAAAGRVVACLSKKQLPSGGFASMGTEAAESAAQVLIALCVLGIDPETDARFIKNNHTVLDGLAQFQTADGAYSHTAGGAANQTATAQAAGALTAYWRYSYKMTPYYRPWYRGKITWETAASTTSTTAAVKTTITIKSETVISTSVTDINPTTTAFTTNNIITATTVVTVPESPFSATWFRYPVVEFTLCVLFAIVWIIKRKKDTSP